VKRTQVRGGNERNETTTSSNETPREKETLSNPDQMRAKRGKTTDINVKLSVFCPLILLLDLSFFLGARNQLATVVDPCDVLMWNLGVVREVVCDVECFSDFLGGLALDHICDSLTTGVKEGLDI
jgi:hypothetical protein